MKLVLAGDNLATLTEYQIQHEQKIGHPFNSINVNKLSPPEIREKLGSLPMFGDQQSWKITGLEKIRSPKMKGELIELLSESTDEIIVVVQSELTPSIKKKFTTHSWQIKEFKMPKVFFQFTESIKVRPLRDCHKLLLKSLEQKNEWELHSLIARQFRLLLAVVTGAPVQAPPFAIPKLRAQAKKFTPEEIIFALHTLFEIERDIKSGQAVTTWSQQIDRLLVRLYDGVRSN